MCVCVCVCEGGGVGVGGGGGWFVLLCFVCLLVCLGFTQLLISFYRQIER